MSGEQESDVSIPVVFLTPEASSSSSSTEVQVSIEEAGYNPDTLEVPVGTTVTWTNAHEAPHTVTSHDEVFSGPGMVPGETFSYTFDTPGTYTYFCHFHPDVEGTIIVTEP